MIEQIEDLTLSELAELRAAWLEHDWSRPRNPRKRTHRSSGGGLIETDREKFLREQEDEDDGKTGGAGVREPRPVIPPAGSAGAVVDPAEDADLPREVGRPGPA